MNQFKPEAFTREWIAAWNRADAEAVLARFGEDAVFVSPLASTVTGNAEVCGKAALRAYWTKALASRPSPPRFQLDSFTWDPERRAILIVYTSIEPVRTIRKSELMHFDPDGFIVRGEAFSGAAVNP